MALNKESIEEAHGLFEKYLGPELTEIIQGGGTEFGPGNPYYIELPQADSIDFTAEELASLVARTSNNYGRVCWLAGKANAGYRLAEGRYKQKFRTSQVGKNEAERQANAMAAAGDEYRALTIIEATVEMVSKMELAARIASESARKLFTAVENMQIAQSRENKGRFKDSDFNSW